MDNKIDEYNIDKDVCREVSVILNKLNLYDRLPEEMRTYLESNQNINHTFDFNDKAPLFEQVGNNETKNVLTYFFIKYINTSEKDDEYCKGKIMRIMEKEYNN